MTDTPRRIPILPEPDDNPAPRRALRCQCDGEAVGPCPGPLNCPYSGETDDNDS